ncbi:hypothetical protein [Croceivirga radicis]|uniref:hypothetical protein n=1 Tax=Croceivirga radicis TaxID=1929488 RepID=UPI000255B3CA|nr:hypothetical protein [Croceivirga radicis]
MNVTEFISILQDANSIISPQQTRELEEMLEEYPYFQAARALHLKGLKNLESYKYNNALKITAAHTTDREVLFDYITSASFENNEIANTILGRTTTLNDKETFSEEIEPNPDTKTFIEGTEEDPLPRNIKEAEEILNPALFNQKEPSPEPGSSTDQQDSPQEIEIIQAQENAKKRLGLGKPLQFSKTEKHSFTEWLQLSTLSKQKLPPAEKEPAQEPPIEITKKDAEVIDLEKKKKFDLLDKFITTNPKIVPNQELMKKVVINDTQKADTAELATETLAKVYLEQKKYKKAIQAYKILSLKYPEKSGFFADQIRAVKQLQKEKN